MTDDYFWWWWEGPWSASDGFECNRKVTRLVNTNHQPATTEGLVDGVYCPHNEGSHSCVTEKTFWKYVVWTWKLLHQSKPVEETFVECCFFRLHFSVALMYYWRSKRQVNLVYSLVSLNTFQDLPKETVSHRCRHIYNHKLWHSKLFWFCSLYSVSYTQALLGWFIINWIKTCPKIESKYHCSTIISDTDISANIGW